MAIDCYDIAAVGYLPVKCIASLWRDLLDAAEASFNSGDVSFYLFSGWSCKFIGGPVADSIIIQCGNQVFCTGKHENIAFQCILVERKFFISFALNGGKAKVPAQPENIIA